MNLDQARGMLVGLAVGDALGAPLEFTEAREPDNYLTEMVGGGTHATAIGEWTDDTSMALAIAESYQSTSEFQADRIQRSFNAWLRDGAFTWRGKCFDIGHTTLSALNTAEKHGYHNPYAGSMNKYGKGNGALMRMAPVIIANHNNRDKCITEAIQQTLLTHGSNTCVDYSVALASDLFACGEIDKYEDLDLPNLRLPKNTDRHKVMSGGYVKETYECAWWAIENTTNFEDAVILAVNRGHDADTVGAVTGQLAGVKYGYDSIPKRWVEVLKMHDNIMDAADCLYHLGNGFGVMPNRQEIESVLAFIPQLTLPDFKPIISWIGEESYPIYHSAMINLNREIDKPCWSGDGSFGYSDQSQDALKQGSLKDIVDFFSRYRRGTQWGGDRWQADVFEKGDVMAALLRLKEFSYDRNSPTTASIPLR